MKLRTTMLRDMVQRAIKGASNNKLIPITGLLKLELKDQKFTLETTDATNYLYVSAAVEDPDAFYAVVNVDLFAKLIAKTTSEYITLNIKDNLPLLSVTGNGTYTIEMPLDDDGTLVKYPDPVNDLVNVKPDFEDIVKRSLVGNILTSVKPSLALTYENPCYTGYYIGPEILATDSYKIAGLEDTFLKKETLISSELMNLLGLITDDKIAVYGYDDKFIFKSSNVTVYGPELDGKDDFAVNAIQGLLSTEFDYNCILSRPKLLAVLDRLSLFISPYDKNAIRLTFAEDGLQLSSKASSGIEVVPYKETNGGSFTCEVDIEMLIQEVKAIPSDTVCVEYGLDNAIKLVDDNLTIVIALLED